MKHRNILGEKFGEWTIVEDNGQRKDDYEVVVGQCSCGSLKTSAKASYMHGSNSQRCVKCSRNRLRQYSIATRS